MASGWYRSKLAPGKNAYVDWSFGPALPYTLNRQSGDWYPALLQLSMDNDRNAETVHAVTKREILSTRHMIPKIINPKTISPIKFPPYLSMLWHEDFFRLFEDPRFRKAVPQVLLGPPISPRSMPKEIMSVNNVWPDSDGSPTEKEETGTTVVAIIDDGIAIANERFRKANGDTRIAYAWVQDADAPNVSPVPYGREYSGSDINTLLAQSTTADAVNEEAFYRRAGLIDFSRDTHAAAAWRIAHGTHVMDLAANYPPGQEPVRLGAANDDSRPIVCVQLPSAITATTSGLGLDPHLSHAIHYVLSCANRIAAERGCKTLPVVINFSYGILAGPHDGTHAIEADIDRIVKDYEVLGQKVRVVLPSGNGYLSRCHAQARFKAECREEELPWRVQPDDKTSSFVEVWLPQAPHDAKQIEVQVVPPGGSASPWLKQDDGTAYEWKPNGVDVLCKLSYSFVHTPTDRGCFTLAVLPTAFHNHPTQLAPSGEWQIRLKNLTLTTSEPVQAWVQRDDTPYSYPVRGRQAFFDHPFYRVYDGQGRIVLEDDSDCPVKRLSTINAFATGETTIVIGGVKRRELTMADFSAAGPATAPSYRRGPDATAISDDSRVHTGVLATGTRSGSVVSMSGTSMAAPAIARRIADDLAAGGRGDRATVHTWAGDWENNRNPQAPNRPRVERGGAGRLPQASLITLPRTKP